MHLAYITVQRCGCVAIPDGLATKLGMLPVGVLAVDLHPEMEVLMLQVAERAASDVVTDRSVCSIEL